MNFTTWLSVISGITGVLAFVFAIWVWLRADTKVREMTVVVKALHDIAVSALWESQMLPGEDASGRLGQLEKSVSLVSAMRTLSAKYAGDEQNYRATELGALVQRGVILSNEMLIKQEKSPDVQHIWLVSHDFEPDISESQTAEMVKRNIAAGKSYVYFYPAEMRTPQEKIRRLQRNIGADDPNLASKVQYIQLRGTVASQFVPLKGNTILFFKDDPTYGTQLVFQEIVLTKIKRRGLFWQECGRDHAVELFDTLLEEMTIAQKPDK